MTVKGARGRNFRNIEGQQFGNWTVLRQGPNRVSQAGAIAIQWYCRCVCGAEHLRLAKNLTNGHSRSCGCSKPKSGLTHGMSRTKEHRTWLHIKARCLIPTTDQFQNYGGRGITVCDEWRGSFEAFYAYVGSAPSPKHTIDRIDNNGNYEPGNVRWATYTEQSRNRRTNVYVDGCIASDWAKAHGITGNTLRWRMRHWPKTMWSLPPTPKEVRHRNERGSFIGLGS